MGNNLPEINIKFGELLYRTISKDLFEYKASKNGQSFMTADRVKEVVQEYQSAWKPKETTILQGMVDSLGLNFSQNQIDVYIAPYVPNISDPLLLNMRRVPDEFIDALTHELFHRLLTQNVQKYP